MTRLCRDQFAQQHFEALLLTFGEVAIGKKILVDIGQHLAPEALPIRGFSCVMYFGSVGVCLEIVVGRLSTNFYTLTENCR